MNKIDIKYINTSKVRRTVSPINFGEDLVYQAHSQKIHGYIPYVPKQRYDALLDECISLKKQIEELKKD